MYKRKFIDLFSGIGAFHQALKEKNYFCPIAVEIDKHARETYNLNYPETKVLTDITDPNVVDQIVETKNIDMITAGFPCQPFSKAGNMKGLKHESGNLFYSIITLVKKYNAYNPPIKFLFFENVGYLKNHDDTATWKKMKESIRKNNYKIMNEDFFTNPIQLNIPQNRVRMFLFCVHDTYVDEYEFKNNFHHKNVNQFFLKNMCTENRALDYIKNVKNDDKLVFLDDEQEQILKIWEEFVQITKIKTLGFPVWLKYFGLNELNTERFKKEILMKEKIVYKWKKNFLEKNRSFYLLHKEKIDLWYQKYQHLLTKKITYQKFEWNSGSTISSIKEGIIQFRHSGIRVKRPNFFPALVKIVHTPIIWDENYNKYRYLSVKEALKLQSFPTNGTNEFKFPENYPDVEAFKRIGNSINVKVISILLNHFLYLDAHENNG